MMPRRNQRSLGPSPDASANCPRVETRVSLAGPMVLTAFASQCVLITELVHPLRVWGDYSIGVIQ